ncbi:hypothetical protein NUV66_03655 [Pseudomonas sp. 32.2.56]|uniref:hypothetical protein n=1 Tax=Pseudomonas sp. 32.2.56 TaxID=2969303 RepID=UPI0021505674|nr:hypothetical protein [Pseudomonas sp. 32.2.56]MCR4508393.1 hypothetical protein [Pseudomonas sp. 32.2.56]
MHAIFTWFGRLSPVGVAFFGSLLLSVIAVLGVVTIGKDAAFYIDIAQRVNADGVQAAILAFDWPWFPILLAWSHSLLGLPYEQAAYLWCALLMAGACALLVDALGRALPGSGLWMPLLVLALPALNSFRNDILREQGFWFFSVLALWLALNWAERGGWLRAAAIHLAIFGAALFRLEALMLFGALALWRLPDLFSYSGWNRLLQIAALPLFGGAVALVVMTVSGGFSQGRVEYYLHLLDPSALKTVFDAKTNALADAVFAKYMDDDAGLLLLGMILLAILFSFIKLCGPVALVFLRSVSWSAFGAYWRQYRLFVCAALIYIVVLVVFFLQQGFVNSRYVSYLNLLALPLLAFALVGFAQKFPRLGRVLAVLLIVQMLDNVISLGAKKTHYVEAGQWLSQHASREASIYYDDPRIGYYAGFGYRVTGKTLGDAMAAPESYRYLLIEADGDEPWLLEWLKLHDLRVLERFANRKDDAVLVIGN